MESKEEWRDIPSYEGYYQVSNFGRVRSLARVVARGDGKIQVKERILKATLDGGGYLIVCLCKSGGRKMSAVHKLVAMVFLGHKPNGHEKVVNHIDNDKSNNRAENLELVSNRHNCSVDKWRHGKTSKYTGVSLKGYYKDGSPKWRVNIRINGKIKDLGTFRDEEEAGKAYQKALEQITPPPRGENPFPMFKGV